MNLKFYIISYKECRDIVMNNLSENEKELMSAYAVNQNYEKTITPQISRINEWDLENYYSHFQDNQYYEYSLMPHVAKNESLKNGITHIGNMHYDTIFKKNAVNSIVDDFSKTPNQIKYLIKITDKNSLYFTKDQLDKICSFLSAKLKLFINSENIWNTGWIGYSMVIAPVWVFEKFGDFMIENKEEVEDIIKNDRWGIRGHRTCGLMERMWGFYVSSLSLPLNKTYDIIHDSTLYEQDAWTTDLKNKLK